jgi:phage baseplate assembly protein W
MPARTLALEYPFRVDGSGRIAAASDVNRQVQIRLIGLISTGLTERVMRPGYGGGMLSRVFETIEPAFYVTAIQDAVRNYEPAVVIDGVDVRSQDIAGGSVELAVRYHMASTGDAYTVTVNVGATATYGWPEGGASG